MPEAECYICGATAIVIVHLGGHPYRSRDACATHIEAVMDVEAAAVVVRLAAATGRS